MSTAFATKLRSHASECSIELPIQVPGMSFTHIYVQYRHKIYSYVFYRVGGDPDIADDLVSEVFMKAYKAFESYNSNYAISTWLYAIARNTLIDHYRKTKEVLNIDDLEIKDDSDPLALLIEKDISQTELLEAINTLPEKQARYVHQQFFEGYTAREIADKENVSHAAVRKQVSRGLVLLREKLLVFTLLLLNTSL